MGRFIAGEVAYKPRYWMRARMPAFTARAHGLAIGLAEEHGYPPRSAEYPKPDPAMAEVGQKLVGKTPNQAFACVQCHAVANVPPFAPFEAPATGDADASTPLSIPPVSARPSSARRRRVRRFTRAT